ncbi:glycine zipper 2TM domain-containing protein [Wenzhouxiangella sp. AB-CW3]|uniref:glycine zipper 2TM domain-containing protein n=1 Tax=Wenzhouxiangella sp. AB-CW3 TaxID=2771012 RepID=UPI00168ABC7C|nr:glycine zipper 2TM domain-containing protein [Wenzhouxiangella sp. AB-CW3]QOC21118.1 glycine zipper 2TM domain-containing protein [Wenzhouxiangella sp. AB-CW3]
MKSALITALLLSAGWAQAGGIKYEHAPVVSVEPRYETHRTPVDREICWEEQGYERVREGGNSTTSTIVGALIGGAVGNRMGNSRSSRRAATAAGAAVGGTLGHEIGRERNASTHYYPVNRERCSVQRDWREERVVSGYRVGYRHDGHVYYTDMPHHPGDSIRIRVTVTPAP